jgi:HAD superfamily hydrolase (TIGR01549 family)
MKKKLFCFDLDDTLVDEDYWFRARWQETFKIYKDVFKPIIIKDFFEIYDLKGPYYKFHLQDLSLVHNEISIFQEKILITFKSVKVNESLFAGVSVALETLSLIPDSKMGIVSNGNYNVVIKRLESLKIYNLFDIIICDSYMKKPNNQSFLTISKNYKDYDLFFIGNDIKLDIIPARENGFEAFLFVKDKINHNSQYNCFFDYFSFPNQFLS